MLSKQEKIILKVLGDLEGNSTPEEIAKLSGLPEVAVMRTLLYLSSKKLVLVDEKAIASLALTKEGEKSLDEGLIEKILIKGIKENIPLSKIELTEEERNIAIGIARRNGWISIEKINDALSFSLTNKGIIALKEKTLEEIALEDIHKKKIVNDNILNILIKRKLVEKKLDTVRKVFLTELGKTEISKGIEITEEISELTPEILKNQNWRNVTLKRFDVSSDVKVVYPSRKHFVNQAIEYIRKIWLEMGFREMSGPMIDTSFWVFDALFQPQDHPARDMQDTFFVESPRFGQIDPKLSDKICAMHEHGGDINSKGWGYNWDKKISEEYVLRTHTTSLSVRTLSTLKPEDLPAKFFSVGKVFRNEKLDWKHLFEFYQTDGIVVDEDANFKHLLGYLKRFLNKMGHSKIRFRPAYFPYTEPSIEVDIYNKNKGEWVELLGAGIFRPEVVVPLLGKDVPVLAWGPGFGRLIMEYYGLTDIRQKYMNDLDMMKKLPIWIKG
ncbi:MAG: Phenylalanine--tRNA ligase alpha subunit [Candidatus Methanofastidiosum methylothiophilum]|uniref:Phenylalanine--tRNA ligase alpha subunit n=1 Tax=Candidatus Methanofastidiosum methylothiophilum TaxID=1705564 RepID=A0A150J1M6_9EURY|nr:MAG: Phenylalanine--tRNA ligase alpha subunit [Candidatus Methanofastidiosum methylthiophilus]KYC48653.1 MAG: Phenylalanine--tRNA ligase alpha subunit [Candidatus Methanofastidiosum methylthiophilus]KYC51142.1 MAG: Phenylalanine--tRNA ligase alpha subunit [Candidatus Methanofastidiosum methylthiophilus]